MLFCGSGAQPGRRSRVSVVCGPRYWHCTNPSVEAVTVSGPPEARVTICDFTSVGLQSGVPPEPGTDAFPSTTYAAHVAPAVSETPVELHAPIEAPLEGSVIE